MRLACSLLILSAVASACAGEEKPAHLSVELGTGTSSFAPLSAGQTVPIYLGIQGGYHLTVNARLKGLDTATSQIVFSGSAAAGGEEVCRGFYRRSKLEPDGDAWRFSEGARCFVGDPAALIDAGFVLRVDVTDGSGTTAADQCELVAGKIIKPY